MGVEVGGVGLGSGVKLGVTLAAMVGVGPGVVAKEVGRVAVGPSVAPASDGDGEASGEHPATTMPIRAATRNDRCQRSGLADGVCDNVASKVRACRPWP